MSAPPIPTTRPFAETAFDLAKRGLAVIPCPGNDGKSPRGAVAGYDRWERPLGPEAIRRFAADHGDANIGIITSLSGLTVADVDEGGRDADEIIRRAGDTPLITRTPSDGLHLFYRSNGEKNANLRPSGLAVDVKASSAGIVIVPPSYRRSTGIPYEFERGTWDDLDRLPFAKPGSLSVQLSGSPGSKLPIQRGQRNDAFFKIALREVRHCDDLDALIDVLATRNEELAEPLPLSEIARLATSAWRLETTGTNWVGQEQRAQIEAAAVEHLSSDENGPDALMLLAHLRLAHGARQTRGEPFAISPSAMSAARKIGLWGPQRYRNARQTLLDLGLISQTHQGAVRVTTLVSSDWAIRGYRLNYNVTEHPPPLSISLECVELLARTSPFTHQRPKMISEKSGADGAGSLTSKGLAGGSRSKERPPGKAKGAAEAD